MSMTGLELAIGQKLRQAREERKLTLEQVSTATRMRVHYLRAIEDGNLDALPSKAQARGFLRAYADFLKIDSESLLAELSGVPTDTSSPPPNQRTNPAQKTSSEPEPDPPATSDVAQSALDAPASNLGADEKVGSPGLTAPQQKALEQPAPLDERTQAIFTDIGRRIKNQRELLGLSLDDVARHTHLRRHYLECLETGNLNGLPSPVQGRGMLENYASFLGLNPEPLLLRFAEGLQTRLSVQSGMGIPKDARREPGSRPMRKKRPLPTPLRRLLSPDVLIGVTFSLFLVVFVVWGAIRIFAMRTGAIALPTAPSIAEVLLATPTSAATVALDTATLSPTGLQAVILPGVQQTNATLQALLPTGDGTNQVSAVQVYVTILQRAWMRVIVDGKIEFEGRVFPGSAYPYVGEGQVEVLTSNGAALSIFYNQQDLGPMGAFGEVVYRIYTPQGILTPTATPIPSPTTTPRLSPTATPPPGLTPTVPVLPH